MNKIHYFFRLRKHKFMLFILRLERLYAAIIVRSFHSNFKSHLFSSQVACIALIKAIFFTIALNHHRKKSTPNV